LFGLGYVWIDQDELARIKIMLQLNFNNCLHCLIYQKKYIYLILSRKHVEQKLFGLTSSLGS